MNTSVLPSCPDKTPILKCRCVKKTKKHADIPKSRRKTIKHKSLIPNKSFNSQENSLHTNNNMNVLKSNSNNNTIKIKKKIRCPNGTYMNKKTGLCVSKTHKLRNNPYNKSHTTQSDTSLPDLTSMFESDTDISPLKSPSLTKGTETEYSTSSDNSITPLPPLLFSSKTDDSLEKALDETLGNDIDLALDKNITVRNEVSKKRPKNLTILKSTTPIDDQLLSKSISIKMLDKSNDTDNSNDTNNSYDTNNSNNSNDSNDTNVALPDSELNSNIISNADTSQSPPDLFPASTESTESNDNTTFEGFKSYSPLIHKQLQSLKTIERQHTDSTCKGTTVKIGVYKNGKDKCRNFKNIHAQAILLHNLSASKHVNPNLVVSPKQIKSNCWFNTMFMTFFISDKGRKFFKYFRQLMIQGRTINGNKIPQKLWHSFFLLNQAIESSLSGNKVMDTNTIIRSVYNNISSVNKYNYISNVNDASNPHSYYLDIINYLGGNKVNPINICLFMRYQQDNISKKDLFDFNYTNHILNYIYNKSNNMSTDIDIYSDLTIPEKKAALENEIVGTADYEKYIPDILIVESLKNIKLSNKHLIILKINIAGKTYKYKLDSATVRDIGGDHFSSLLTLEGKEYAFDGGSYKRLIPFKWKKHVNTNWNWQFEELQESINKSPITMTWNFAKEYSALYYYRIK